jgi:hypothetical protein
MKRALFSIALITIGMTAIGGFEAGDGMPEPPGKAWAARNDALARARVFRDAAFDASAMDFSIDPNRGIVNPALTTCRYKPDEVTGTTPKFDCQLAGGETIKVKYGWTKEIPSEIAATRLLGALGFGADRVSRVEMVRCYGCPPQPFHTRSLAELLGLDGYLDAHLDYTAHRDFHDVSVERNLDGEAIEAGTARGWAFYELTAIDPSRGGAPREEVDALRLMAVFLHHWDNKAANQRLICAGRSTPDCAHPLVMIQDAGSAFGPKKINLHRWRARPVWKGDASQCLLSMKDMPYGGGTFEDVAISEGGRRMLAERLRQLPSGRVEALFSTAGFEDTAEWASAFHEKVRQIANRPACLTAS